LPGLLLLLLLLLVELRVRRRIRVGRPRCRRTIAILARVFRLTVTTSVARLVAGTDLTRLPGRLRPFVWRDIRAVRWWILLRRHLPRRRRNAHGGPHVPRILILHPRLRRLCLRDGPSAIGANHLRLPLERSRRRRWRRLGHNRALLHCRWRNHASLCTGAQHAALLRSNGRRRRHH